MSTQAEQTQASTEKEDGKRVWVGGLALERVQAADDKKRVVLREAVADLCSHYGRVKQCQVIGKKATSAIVLFESHEDAENAIQKLREKKNWHYSFEGHLKADWSGELPDKTPKQNRPARDDSKPKKAKKPSIPLSCLTPKNPATAPQTGAPRTGWELPSAQPQTPPQKNEESSPSENSDAPADPSGQGKPKRQRKRRNNKGPGAVGQANAPATNGGEQGEPKSNPASAKPPRTFPAPKATQDLNQSPGTAGPDGQSRRGGRRGGRGGRGGGPGQGGQGRGQNKGQTSPSPYKDHVLAGTNHQEAQTPPSQPKQTQPTKTPKQNPGQQTQKQEPAQTTTSEQSTTQAKSDPKAPAGTQPPKTAKAPNQPKGQPQKQAQAKGQPNTQNTQKPEPKSQTTNQPQTGAAGQKQAPKGKPQTNGSAKPTTSAKEDNSYQIIVLRAGKELHNFPVSEEQFQTHLKSLVK